MQYVWWLMKNAYNILVEKPEGKISRGRTRHTWEYNIELDFKEIRGEGVGWV
jgi:hypothetical protein